MPEADEIQEPELETAVEVEELSIDALFNQGVEEDQVTQGLKDASMPVGSYTTEVPPLKIGVKRDDKGRLFVNAFFKVTMGDTKGAIGYRFSPDRKDAVNRDTGESTGKPDRAYKNYLQSYNAFTRATGQKPANVGEVAAYIRDYPVKLRIIQLPDGENMVVALQPVI